MPLEFVRRSQFVLVLVRESITIAFYQDRFFLLDCLSVLLLAIVHSFV